MLNNPDYRLVHCDEIWIRNGVRVNPRIKYLKEGGDIFMRCLNLCAMAPSAVIMQRSLFEELRGFEESLPACEDYDMWLKVCSRNPVLYVDKQLLTKYGGHEDQLSTQHWGMDRFRVQALNRLLGSDVLGDEKYAAARSVLIEKCEILRLGALKRKNQRMAWQYRNLMEKFPAREGSQSDA